MKSLPTNRALEIPHGATLGAGGYAGEKSQALCFWPLAGKGDVMSIEETKKALKEAVGGLKKLEAMVEAKEGEGNDLINLPGDICMEAFKLKALADLTFCETPGDEIIFENSNNACGFSMLLSDIADRIQKVAGQIETGFIPRKAPEPGERGAI